MSSMRFTGPLRTALLAAAACLAGCATGQGSFIAGSDGGGGDGEFFDDGFFFDEEAAPGLLAAGGNALLPGSRNPAAASLLGRDRGGSGGGSGLGALDTTLDVDARLGGPLLGLRGGRTALLGLNTGAGTLGYGANVGAVLGVGVSPTTAQTQLINDLTVSTTTPNPPGGGQPANPNPPATPPVAPPLIAPGVPGTIPLGQLLPRPPVVVIPTGL